MSFYSDLNIAYRADQLNCLLLKRLLCIQKIGVLRELAEEIK